MPDPLRRSVVVFAMAAAAAGAVASSPLVAQVPGSNVNMVSGTTLPDGDPFLQRQNEPSLAVSTRNPQHILAGANDYRTVDLPGLPDDKENGDAWLGVYKSTDGGRTWRSTLLPGFPQDSSPIGLASPLHGYAAAADPIVRAGANGLFFFGGIAFNRGEKTPGAVFVARFSDDNNKENGDPIRYLGTTVVASEATAKFLDKPWLAVDQPRGDATCVVGGETLAAGMVYIAYSLFNGPGAVSAPPRDDDREPVTLDQAHGGKDKKRKRPHDPDDEEKELHGRIMFSRSRDCGVTWSRPIRISSARDVNQGATIAIDPVTGAVFVAWRQFAEPDRGTDDAFFVTQSHNGGRSFATPTRVSHSHPFDQGTTPTSIRTTAYPTIAIDQSHRVYIAWAARGFASRRPDPSSGDSRIVVSTAYATEGLRWSQPHPIDNSSNLPGHQIMPALAYAAGRLQIAYYDLREDRSQIFEPYLDDLDLEVRHTVDVRTAQAFVAPDPVFKPYSVTRPGGSARVTDYAWGTRPGVQQPEQLEFNPPNLPLFKRGTAPFLGDYLDVAAAPAFVLSRNGRWVFNTAADNSAVFLVAWTDNRNVTPPLDGDWSHYTPPIYTGPLLQPGQQVAACAVGQTGMRNQNIYSSLISPGLVAGSPGNTKPLSPTLQRSFVVFARNTTGDTRSYRLEITNQPLYGRASFAQFPLPPYDPTSPLPVTVAYVRVPPLSMAARTVFATSTDPAAPINVAITEVVDVGGERQPGGESTVVQLNGDRTNPAITNPDVENPAITNPDIAAAEVSTPAITNPAITNPAITNPAITNPDIATLRVVNPDITNPAITNPAITNPAITNPAITNPAITNPDLVNGSITDVTWTITNNGNTAAAYSTRLFLASAPIDQQFKLQLIVHKTYETPVAIECELRTETYTEVLVNQNNPTVTGQFGVDVLDPSDVTFVVNPGEHVKVTLRIVDPDITDGVTMDVAHAIVPAIRAQSVNSDEAVIGVPEAPAVTPPSVRALAFVTEPSTFTAGQSIAPTVKVRLAGLGNASIPGEPVTLALSANTWGGLLLGTTTAITDSNGVATFPTITVTVPGVGYKLQASTPAAGPEAASQPFTVLNDTGASVDVAVVASHGPAAPVVGGTLSYTVTVSNNALTAATNVMLSDPVPAGVTFVSALPSQGSCGQAVGLITCQLGTVVGGSPVTIAMTFTPNVAEPAINQAFVSAFEPDADASNNTATDSVSIAPTADGLIGIFNVYSLYNASGCTPTLPNPFQCNYLSGPVLVDPAITPPGTYRVEILQPLDPANVVGGFHEWDGDSASGIQNDPGVEFHHGSGNMYLYAHDWYPWENPPSAGWQIGVYRLSVDPTIEDTFEAPAIDGAWTVSPQNGTIGVSTDQNWTPGGQQSLKFSSSAGGQRSIVLERSLAGFSQGVATIHFYDTAPGVETLYTNFTLLDSTTGINATLGIQDFDAFCYKAMVIDPAFSTNFGPNANCGAFPQASTTNIARTVGWHVFSIRWDSQTVILSIDDQQVFQMSGTFHFDKAHIDLSGPFWRPNATYYFDDFSIRP